MFTHCPPKKFKKYQEAVAVTAKGGERVYTTPTGNAYPSVTTVLKAHSQAGIQAWRKRVGDEEANRVAARAGGRGTRIHNLTEHFLNNVDPLPVKLADKEMWNSLQKPLHRINNIRLQETALYSDTLRLAGRVDCIAEYRNELMVIDFKTSRKKKKPEYIEGYCMQVCAYGVMYQQHFNETIEKGAIIIGVEDEKPQVFIVELTEWYDKLVYYRDLWESSH